MPIDDKVQEIMALAGVLPRDRDRAAKNYAELSEAEIDGRLDRLRAARGQVAAWRQTRAAPAEAAAPAAVEPSRPAWVADLDRSYGDIDRHLRDLTQMVERLRRWRPPMPQPLAEQVSARIGHLSALQARVRDTYQPLHTLLASVGWEMPPGQALSALAAENAQSMVSANAVLALVAKYLSIEVAGVVQHPLLWSDTAQLTPFETIEALARLEHHIDVYRPDMILALNSEGWSIASLVIDHLGLAVPIVTVRGAAASGLTWPSRLGAGIRPRTVCVVGHVARTGETMLQTMHLVRARLQAEHVFGAVLASSMDAVERLGGNCRFVFHQLSEAPIIDLGFDAAQGVAMNPEGYVFGAWRGDAAGFAVPRDRLEQARGEIARRYPVDPLF